VATGLRQQRINGGPITLTNINGIFPYTQAAREIGEAQRWDNAAIEVLTCGILAAITCKPPQLATRDKLTGLKTSALADVVLHLVHPDDVNEWLESQGLDYRWTAPNAEPPDPERRLARLRTLRGSSTYRDGEWRFRGIAALVKSEKAEGRTRCDEKTIRADLKTASESERNAKAAGFASGLGQR
jgi:hypothetical protein